MMSRHPSGRGAAVLPDSSLENLNVTMQTCEVLDRESEAVSEAMPQPKGNVGNQDPFRTQSQTFHFGS